MLKILTVKATSAFIGVTQMLKQDPELKMLKISEQDIIVILQNPELLMQNHVRIGENECIMAQEFPNQDYNSA